MSGPEEPPSGTPERRESDPNTGQDPRQRTIIESLQRLNKENRERNRKRLWENKWETLRYIFQVLTNKWW